MLWAWLVNNAGISRPHRIEDVTDSQLQLEIGTNLLGPIYTVREAIPLLRRSTAPHVINVSSESVNDPYPFLLVYGLAKAGLEHLTRGLVQELRPDGIRCTVLRIGQTATTIKDEWDPDALREAVAAWDAGGYRVRMSGKVPQSPERVAEAVLIALRQTGGSLISELSVRAYP